jgi:predicted dehydrogenase
MKTSMSTKAPLKIAIVGCGKFADAHAETIQKLPNARLVAACDAEPLMAEQLATRFSIPEQFSDVDEMLHRVRPDAVHIATPPQTHLMLAIKAMDAGAHVFVEKPLALNFTETKRLVAHAESTGLKLTTGWRANFDPPALTLRRLVDEGVIGDVVHVDSFYGYDLSGPFGAAFRAEKDHWVHRLPGKLFHNNIDHLLNKFTGFMGLGAPSVIAQAYSYHGGSDDDLPDELRIMLRGGRVSGYATFSANVRPMGHTLTVQGTKQSLTVDYVSRTVTKLPSAIGRIVPAFTQAWRFYREGMHNVIRFMKSDYHYFAGLNHLIAAFYESIEHDSAPPIPYRDLLWVNGVMEDVISQIDTKVCRS